MRQDCRKNNCWDVPEPLKYCVWRFPAEGAGWDGCAWDYWDNLCPVCNLPQTTVFGFLKQTQRNVRFNVRQKNACKKKRQEVSNLRI